MRDDIRQDVLANIKRDYRFDDRAGGDWLQKGRCPQCGKKELFTRASSPWVLRCGRANRCGWEGHVKDLYPEIFDNWSTRHMATEADPNAAADAYLLHARGLDLRHLRGSYAQETYHDRDRNLTSATVRFPLPGGSWWERLITSPAGSTRKRGFVPAPVTSGNGGSTRPIALPILPPPGKSGWPRASLTPAPCSRRSSARN